MKNYAMLLVGLFMFFNGQVKAKNLGYVVDTQKSKIAWEGKKKFDIGDRHFGTIGIQSGTINYSATQGFFKDKNKSIGQLVVDMQAIEVDPKDIPKEKVKKRNKLIGHLKSDHFFNVGKYKTASIVLTEAKKLESGQYQFSGNLQIRDKVNPLIFVADLKREKNGHLLISAEDVKVDRSQFDVKYNSPKFKDYVNILKKKVIDDIFTLDVTISAKMATP